MSVSLRRAVPTEDLSPLALPESATGTAIAESAVRDRVVSFTDRLSIRLFDPINLPTEDISDIGAATPKQTNF